jgi:hypothetical protein
MTNPYTVPITEQFRLYESKKMTQVLTGADIGRTLDSVLQTYYGLPNGLADLTATFVDDFTDITASMGDNTGGKTWMAPAEIGLAGIVNCQSFTGSNVYSQVDGTTLGMSCRRDAGVAKRGCNAATAFYGTNLDATPIIKWVQQYGYFEAKFKPADPTGTNAVCYPAFWLRSQNFYGDDPTRVNIEDDIIEHYNADPTSTNPTTGAPNFSQDRGLHTTMHKHEPAKLISPGQWGRDVSSNDYVNTRSYAGFGNPADFEMWNAYHTYSVLHCPDFNWYFYDRKLYAKFTRTPEMQERYAMYISHLMATEAGNTGGYGGTVAGWVAGVNSTALWDYVKAWQLGDWQTTPLGSNIIAGIRWWATRPTRRR